MAVRAAEIIALLAVKHAADVFVPECKDGPTGGHAQLDAWVMPRSWARPAITGYEVKISRTDFVRDVKWPRYLDACNLLYFACPYGLIAPEETPEGCGLMWVAKTGTRLYIKRKAPYREIPFPEHVARYVLMARSEVRRGGYYGRQSPETWRQWLSERQANRTLGREVGGKIRELYQENVERADAENRHLRAELDRLSEVRAWCDAHGVRLRSYDLDRQLTALTDAIPPEVRGEVKAARKALEKLDDRLASLDERDEAA